MTVNRPGRWQSGKQSKRRRRSPTCGNDSWMTWCLNAWPWVGFQRSLFPTTRRLHGSICCQCWEPCASRILYARDVERAARKAVKYPVQRNRMLAVASRLFSLAEYWEMRGQNSNPAKGIERAKENARDRVLAGTELQALSVALDELERHYPYEVAAIRTAALTGLRISECLSLRWETHRPRNRAGDSPKDENRAARDSIGRAGA